MQETFNKLLINLLQSKLDPSSQIEQILKFALQSTDSERGFVIACAQENEPKFLVSKNIEDNFIPSPQSQISKTLIKMALDSKKPIRILNPSEDPNYNLINTMAPISGRSIMLIPIISGENLTALIYLDRNSSKGPFTEPDEKNLCSTTEQISGFLKEVIDKYFDGVKLEKMGKDLSRLLGDLRSRYDFSYIVGKSKSLMDVLNWVAKAAQSTVPVFIEGESGVGKELLARAIHFNSSRASKPFVSVNCSAISPTIIESELFGHEKGSFTGAIKEREGFITAANDGTLMLDEITELPVFLQPKLLRAIQFGEVQKVGSSSVENVNLRIIATTNRDVKSHIKEGKFREDLYYRLKVIHILVPPLRQRADDIPILVNHICAKIAPQIGMQDCKVDEEAMEILKRYQFPGNVRELEGILYRACAISKDNIITVEDIPEDVLQEVRKQNETSGGSEPKYHNMRNSVVEESEKEFLRKILGKNSGNVTEAAREAGISRATMYRMITKYKLNIRS